MSHMPLSLINGLKQTESAVSKTSVDIIEISTSFVVNVLKFEVCPRQRVLPLAISKAVRFIG